MYYKGSEHYNRQNPKEQSNIRGTYSRDIMGNKTTQSSNIRDAYQTPVMQSGMDDMVEEIYYIDIDSRERDRTIWPDPQNYQIKFQGTSDHENVIGQVYKNIKSIELISMCIPNTNNVLDEQYLLLQIDEINNKKRRSANINVDKAFTRLIFQDLAAVNYLCIDKDISSPLILEYPKNDLLASLSKMTISLRRYDGTLFDFGTDTVAPTPFDETVQNSMTFKITELVRDTSKMGKRII